jgi:hypothetical protein
VAAGAGETRLLALAQDFEAKRRYLEAFAPAVEGIGLAGHVAAFPQDRDGLRRRLAGHRQVLAQPCDAVGARGDGPQGEVVDRAYVGESAAGEFVGRAVHQRAETAQEEKREISAGAGHHSRLRERSGLR